MKKNQIKLLFASYKPLIILVFNLKLFLILIIVLGKYLVKPNIQEGSYTALGLMSEYGKCALDTFDGQYYQAIAIHGYHSIELVTFFPLYPLTINMMAKVLGNTYIAGIFISWFFGIATLFYLYKLFKLDTNEKNTLWSLFYFLIYPATIVYATIYSESMFLFLVVLAIYYGRTKKWCLASIFGFLASLTRLPGLILLPVLLVEFYTQNKNETKNKASNLNLIYLILIPLGTILYFYYIGRLSGNFLAPITTQSFYARQNPALANYLELIKNTLNINQLPFFSYRLSIFELSMTIFFAFSVYFMIKNKLRASYILYAILLIAIPLSTGNTTSMARFLSASFPHFLLFGIIANKHIYFRYILAVVFILLMIVCTIKFINWYWVF
jgi:Gpi18-like mannosyltransferase